MNAIRVVASGARTPLGLRTAPSAAALRAGIGAAIELPHWRDKMNSPVLFALDPQLDPSLTGTPRILAMAENALREACAPLYALRHARLQVPIFLGLPEPRAGFASREIASIVGGLRAMSELPLSIPAIETYAEGHASGYRAFGAAIDRILRGQCEFAIVGGLDSYYHPETLEWLDENRQLAGADSRSSFVPGEAAGFCLLASDSACAKHALSPIAVMEALRIGRETALIKTDSPCFGDGLTTTVREALEAVRTEFRVNDVICDINGERYRGEEWGFVCLRLAQFFGDPTDYLSPADCWGDVGAASAPLFAMLACEASARGYARGSRCLLWGGSENGLRGAAVLRTSAMV